jgi:hypothetical protein|nr:MAG TPA: hypothetical protein [Caudoviricetes sp.]
MLRVTDDFEILIQGESTDLLTQYGTLTAHMYRSFIENDVGKPAEVMLMLTKALVAGIETAQKGGETDGN